MDRFAIKEAEDSPRRDKDVENTGSTTNQVRGSENSVFSFQFSVFRAQFSVLRICKFFFLIREIREIRGLQSSRIQKTV
jgi:hypothetical protein